METLAERHGKPRVEASDGASSCGSAREEGARARQGCQAPSGEARAEVLHVFKHNSPGLSCQTWTTLAGRESRAQSARGDTCVTVLRGVLKPPIGSDQTKLVPFPSGQAASADAFGWVRLRRTLGDPKLCSGDLSDCK